MAKHVPHSHLNAADNVIHRGIPVNVVLNVIVAISLIVDDMTSTNIKNVAIVVIIIIVVLLVVPCKLLVNEVDVFLFS